MNQSKSLIKYFFYLFLLILGGCKPSIPPVPAIDLKSLTPNQSITLKTLKKTVDSPLYSMTYSGNYDPVLRDFIYKAIKLQKPNRGCTVFAALNPEGEPVLARNHDYFFSPALVLFTNPPHGYASVSMVDLSFLGFDTPEKLASMSDQDRTKMLYAPYLPCDGMNEYDLTVGMTYVPEANYNVNSERETIYSLEAVRLLLDHAKNTKEAIELLSKYNITFPILPSHFLIADSSGDVAIIEFIKGEMELTCSKEPWMVASNFLIHGNADSIKKHTREVHAKGDTSRDVNGKSFFRYVTAYEDLKKADGMLFSGDAMQLLKKISLKKMTREIWMTTQWSVVYQMNSGEVQVAMDRDYNKLNKFKLEIKHKCKIMNQ